MSGHTAAFAKVVLMLRTPYGNVGQGGVDRRLTGAGRHSVSRQHRAALEWLPSTPFGDVHQDGTP
jgi:hypothetical protein